MVFLEKSCQIISIKQERASKMNLDEFFKIVNELTNEEKKNLLSELNNNRYFNTIHNPEKSLNLFTLEEHEIKKIITLELKKQGITYEEMAMQIDVSIATFKRIVAKPLMAKTINLHSLLKELGFKLCLEK